MRGMIKGLLAEELKNSLQMKKEYEAALKALPKGCLVRKVINGRAYYYVVQRRGPKVVYRYKGKVSPEELDQANGVKERRAKYRKLLSRVKKQAVYLKGALRGKEPI